MDGKRVEECMREEVLSRDETRSTRERGQHEINDTNTTHI